MDIKTTAREQLLMNLSCYDTAFALMLVIGLWILASAVFAAFISGEAAFALVFIGSICLFISVVAKAFYFKTLRIIREML